MKRFILFLLLLAWWSWRLYSRWRRVERLLVRLAEGRELTSPLKLENGASSNVTEEIDPNLALAA